jgi:hypothetical protein
VEPLARFDGAKRSCAGALQRRRERVAEKRTLNATAPPPPPPLGFFAFLPLTPLLPAEEHCAAAVHLDPLAAAAAAEVEERLLGSAALYSAVMAAGATDYGHHPHTTHWL